MRKQLKVETASGNLNIIYGDDSSLVVIILTWIVLLIRLVSYLQLMEISIFTTLFSSQLCRIFLLYLQRFLNDEKKKKRREEL